MGEFRRIGGWREGSWVARGSRSTGEGNLLVYETKSSHFSISFCELFVQILHRLFEINDMVTSYISVMIMLVRRRKHYYFHNVPRSRRETLLLF